MIQRKVFNVTLLFALTLTIDIAKSAVDETRATVAEHDIHQQQQQQQQQQGCGGAPKKDYNFITEYKRLPQYRYIAAYKRFPDYLYSFGIGKRFDDNIKRASPYSFGVGKRNNYDKFPFIKLPIDYNLPYETKNYQTDSIINDLSQIKRGSSPHAYGFGIGKRDLSSSDEFYNDNDDNGGTKFTDNGQLWDQY